MFLISCVFCNSRSIRKPKSEGVFYLTLSEKCVGEDRATLWKKNTINTGIKSQDGVLTDEIRKKLSRMTRLLYCVIENFDLTGDAFERIDIITKFKLALRNDESMSEIIQRSQTKFPLRSDLVSVGNELKREFQFIHTINYDNIEVKDSLYGFLIQKCKDFKNDGKEATARAYISTAKSIGRFTEGKPINLSFINKEFIIGYSDWLKENGVSDSTQSFYLRTLRSALNYATKERGIDIEENLFNGLNTKIYKASKEGNMPKMTHELLKKISTLNLKNDKETELVRDMFMFGFYCHGLELSDLLNLKKENIIDSKLVFSRRKRGKTIEIQLDKSALDILKRYKDSSDGYLFPIMDRYQGFLYHSIFERVRQSMCKIRDMVGCQSLSFSSNILAWHQIVSQLDLSAVLLGRLG